MRDESFAEAAPGAIVIPAHNEMARLPTVLARLARVSLAVPHLVIVVDDLSSLERGSTVSMTPSDRSQLRLELDQRKVAEIVLGDTPNQGQALVFLDWLAGEDPRSEAGVYLWSLI